MEWAWLRFSRIMLRNEGIRREKKDARFFYVRFLEPEIAKQKEDSINVKIFLLFCGFQKKIEYTLSKSK